MPDRELTPRFTTVALVGLLPVISLAVYCLWVGSAAIQRAASDRSRDVTRLTVALVEREFDHHVGALGSLARAPNFVANVRAHDEAGVRERLATFVQAHPRVVRGFVTTPEGLLWSDHPKAEASLGESFAHREWYRGVTARWRPYVSPVYRRHAPPRLLLVAVAVPVFAEGEVAGIAVCQVRLEEIAGLLQAISAPRGRMAFLVDQTGKVVAHPELDLQAREHEDYAEAPPVLAARDGGADDLEYVDPILGERVVATSAPCAVAGARWAVVVQETLVVARRPVVALVVQTAVAGLLAVLLLAGVAWVQVRTRARIGGLVGELRLENHQRRAAEAGLQEANEQLEARVDERTRELRETQEQLLHAQKLEAVARLAGGVAHDFNNLLTVILGLTELELAQVEAGSSTAASLQEIQAAGQRAAGLTGQLLAFSRKQVLQPQRLDVSAVLRDLETLLVRLLGEDVDLVVRGDAVAPVLADPGQIAQVVMNLAVNARDAMPRGGKLTIETANVDLDEGYARAHADARPGPHVLLAVSDTGEGMDAETCRRIFEPFFTTKELGRGTGLGLSTVYGIVKQSGGNIWVYSEVGRGTTFKVYLPRDEGPIEGPTEGPTEETAPERRPTRRPATATVLVVEDDEGVRRLVSEVLAGAGHTVLVAEAPAEARRLLEARVGGVDLLLTDVVLPGESGAELAQDLARSAPDLRVLYMSGYTDHAVVRCGVLKPGTAFIEKPLTPRKLMDKVEALLAGEEDATR